MSSQSFSDCIRSASFLAFPLMGACSTAGQIAKDSAAGATRYYSSEHFTLVTNVPTNFGFSVNTPEQREFMLSLRLDPKCADDVAWQPLQGETPDQYFARCQRVFDASFGKSERE
jgi:hypothetical protein